MILPVMLCGAEAGTLCTLQSAGILQVTAEHHCTLYSDVRLLSYLVRCRMLACRHGHTLHHVTKCMQQEGKVVSKSRVASTYGMPEGAELVLSSFELEVGPSIEAQRFRCSTCHISTMDAETSRARPCSRGSGLSSHRTAGAGLVLALSSRQHRLCSQLLLRDLLSALQ